MVMRFLRIGAAGTAQVSIVLCALYSPAMAGEADVLAVEVTKQAPRYYRFDVTVRHADEGWNHYADNWQIIAPDGTVLATRVLAHPHVNEQPFTRSLSLLESKMPAGVRTVAVRAHDSVHGNGGAEVTVAIPE